MGLVPSKEETRQPTGSFFLCEDTEGGRQSASQKRDRQEGYHAGTVTLDFQPPEP